MYVHIVQYHAQYPAIMLSLIFCSFFFLLKSRLLSPWIQFYYSQWVNRIECNEKKDGRNSTNSKRHKKKKNNNKNNEKGKKCALQIHCVQLDYSFGKLSKIKLTGFFFSSFLLFIPFEMEFLIFKFLTETSQRVHFSSGNKFFARYSVKMKTKKWCKKFHCDYGIQNKTELSTWRKNGAKEKKKEYTIIS